MIELMKFRPQIKHLIAILSDRFVELQFSTTFFTYSSDNESGYKSVICDQIRIICIDNCNRRLDL